MDMVYLMVNEKGQTEPVQLVSASGVPQPLDASDPLVARLSTGPGSGRPVRLPRERNEFVEAVEFTEYHYFVDENNKVIPIPPGSIVHGEFEDEEDEDDNADHDLQENDQLRNDMVQVSSEIAQVVPEMELPAAECKAHLEEEVGPCSGDEQEVSGQSEPAETALAEGHPGAVYGDFGVQEHSGATTMNETGELQLDNSAETIFTQDEIELEEEVVSLQISEPEHIVAVKPSIKYSKRAAIFTSHHDISGSAAGRSTDASSLGESQAKKSPLKKSKKKPTAISGATESQASTVEKISLQSGRKGLHPHSVEPPATPNASEPSVSETGRPKRSVPRRSALEMLHGEGKARKPHASSGSDSEVDGGTAAAQHSGKRRQSKGVEKKALTAEKLAKTPVLPNTELKNETQLILMPQDLSTVNADQKRSEIVGTNSASTPPLNVQSPAVSVKRGKGKIGRPKKLVSESQRAVETPGVTSAVQKESVSIQSASTAENRDDSGQEVTFAAVEGSSIAEAVVTSEIDVVSKSDEFSDSKLVLIELNSSNSTELSFIDVVEPGGMEIEAEHSEVVTSETVEKAETMAAGSQPKHSKHRRGRRKSAGERRKASLSKNAEKAEGMDRVCVEITEANVVSDTRQMETEISVDATSEHLLWSPECGVDSSNLDGELRSGQVIEDAIISVTSNMDGELRSGQVIEDAIVSETSNMDGELRSGQEAEGHIAGVVADDLSEKEGHSAAFECSSSIHESEEVPLSGNLLKEDCESVRIVGDDSATSDPAICKEVEVWQMDNDSEVVELTIQKSQEEQQVEQQNEQQEEQQEEQQVEQQEERLVIDEAVKLESQLAAERLVESYVHSGNGDLETNVASPDAYQSTRADDETTVEVEMYDAPCEDNSCLVESQSEYTHENLIDTGVEMREELPGKFECEIERDSVVIDVNHEAIQADAEEEKCLAPVEEKEDDENEEDAALDHQVHDEEDIQDFDQESTGEPEAAANLASDGERALVEVKNPDRMEISSQLTRLLLKHHEDADAYEHSGTKVETDEAIKKFKERVLGFDCKTALLVSADLEHLAKELRCRMADRQAAGDKEDSAVNQSYDERTHRLAVAEMLKVRACDQELDNRRTQQMVVTGQLNRRENDLKQREQRLERDRMLLALEREAIEAERRKLSMYKEKESRAKQQKLRATLRQKEKRKAETEAELNAGNKKVCVVADPVPVTGRRPLFEAITAIKQEMKTAAGLLQASNNVSSSEDHPSVSVQKQISSSADECESKDSVKIEMPSVPDVPVEMTSGVKAEVESPEEKSCVKMSDVLSNPFGLPTIVKGKKEILRRYTADERYSPGDDEQRTSKSLLRGTNEDEAEPESSSHMPTEDYDEKLSTLSSYTPKEDGSTSSKSSSHKPRADEQKPRKSSSNKSTVDEQNARKSSNKSMDEQKTCKSSSNKSTVDEHKTCKSSSLKRKADEPKARKSSHKPTADERKPDKSSSHKRMKLDTSSSSSSTSGSLVKKSGQPSSKHTPQSPTISSPASSVSSSSVLNQSKSLKSKKKTSPVTSSRTGTDPKSSSGKRGSSHGDGERRKDLQSSPRAKKQHVADDVQDSAESSSKSGCKDHLKRLSAHSDGGSKKKDNKQCKRFSAV